LLLLIAIGVAVACCVVRRQRLSSSAENNRDDVLMHSVASERGTSDTYQAVPVGSNMYVVGNVNGFQGSGNQYSSSSLSRTHYSDPAVLK
jgi:hypothetical protein